MSNIIERQNLYSDEDLHKIINFGGDREKEHAFFQEESPELNKFRFYNQVIIEAENIDQAKEIFANNSFNFAADASCEQVS